MGFNDGDQEEEFGPEAVNRLRHLQITPEKFKNLCASTDFRDILRTLDIPDEEQLDLFDTLDIDGGGTLDLEELIQGVYKLRGDARRSDIVGVSLQMRHMQEEIQSLQKDLKELISNSETRFLHMCRLQRPPGMKNEASTAPA